MLYKVLFKFPSSQVCLTPSAQAPSPPLIAAASASPLLWSNREKERGRDGEECLNGEEREGELCVYVRGRWGCRRGEMTIWPPLKSHITTLPAGFSPCFERPKPFAGRPKPRNTVPPGGPIRARYYSFGRPQDFLGARNPCLSKFPALGLGALQLEPGARRTFPGARFWSSNPESRLLAFFFPVPTHF